MTDAISFHLEGLQAEGLDLPTPHASTAYVDIPAWRDWLRCRLSHAARSSPGARRAGAVHTPISPRHKPSARTTAGFRTP
jgi:hypothetical protein